MDKTKLIAVVVVIIIVVAAAAIVLTRGGSDSGDDANIDAELRVFGNADGNYTIDRNDLSIINDIVAGNLDASDYPMADANYDGAITQADADLVQSIINGEPCTVYHYNTCTTGDYVVDTKWPVKSALATGASNMLWIMTMAGMDGMVHGITYSASSSPDPTIFPEFSKMESIGGSSTKLPVDNASSYISKYDVTAVVADKTASTVDKGTVEVQYESMGVDVILRQSTSTSSARRCSCSDSFSRPRTTASMWPSGGRTSRMKSTPSSRVWTRGPSSPATDPSPTEGSGFPPEHPTMSMW